MPETPHAIRGPRDRNLLPGGALRVSPFCFGIAREPALVTEAYRAGMNFFFVSTDLHLSMYLNSVLGLRALLASGEARRDDIVVAAVSYLEQPSLFASSIPELLWLLPELGHIDIAVAGGCCSEQDYSMRRETLLELKATNVVRAIGVSFHSRSAALQAISRDDLDIAFIRYNPAHPGARDDLFPHIIDRRTLVYNFLSTGGHPGVKWASLGLDDSYWKPTYADYYRFALTELRVDGVLCAPLDARQIGAIGPQLELGSLDDDEQEYLCDLAAVVEGRATLAAIAQGRDDDES